MTNTVTLGKAEKAYLREELREYMRVTGALTAEEKTELRGWVAEGNGVNANPWLLYDESGRMEDFITGCRINADMREHPDDYSHGEAGLPAGDMDADRCPF